jgi:hypothetical protein
VNVLHTIHNRIVVTGRRIVAVRLTPSAYAHGAAFVAAGGSVAAAAALLGIRPSTAKRHLADLRARSGLTTEQLIYVGRAAQWLLIPSLEPS